MKILHVHPTFTSVKGGVERHIEGLSKHLARRGHHVDILTTERGQGITYEGNRINVKRGHNFFSFFNAGSYDIVHVHGYRVPWANLFGFFQKLGGSKVVMTTHGIYPSRSATDTLAKKIYDWTIGGVNVRLFDAFIALTPETEGALLSLGAQQDKIRIIPNSIDIGRFEKLPSPEVFLGHYHIPSDRQVILCVGRMDWNKGLDLALVSFFMSMKEIPSTILVFVGRDCGYLRRLKQLSRKLGLNHKVLFTGEISETMLCSVYGIADALLLTSFYEGLPTVVLEAMACCVPVIAFRTGGTSYVIEHGKTGLLADYGDYKSIAEQLLLVLSDKPFKKQLVKRASNLVKERYNWAKNSVEVEQLYDRINSTPNSFRLSSARSMPRNNKMLHRYF